MRKLWDVFYINANQAMNEITHYGLEFKEFIQFVPGEVKNLLLLESEYYGTGFSSKSRFWIVNECDMNELISDDIYGYGNFSWVDFNERENVEKLEPREVADLLYMGHMNSPIGSPFFEKINNRFAYLAHDDGWYCKLYCKRFADFSEVMANKIISMASTSKRRRIYPIAEELRELLLNLAEGGLIIDFSNMMRFSKSIEVPIHVIGKFENMDEMYNGLKEHIKRSKYSASLVHKNKVWTVEYIVKKGAE